MIVAKFGGSSMADAEAMRRSAGVAKRHEGTIVVVSATYGTTNNLIRLAQTAEKDTWEDCQHILREINEKHHEIAKELSLIEDDFQKMTTILDEMETLARGINLLRDCSLKAMDNMLSIGERLSSTLFTHALAETWGKDKQVEYFDVRDVLKTDDRHGKAMPQFEKIAENAKRLFSPDKIYVTQGFIGSTEDGVTTTLGRGGSDYSAALLAEGIGAHQLQIWTDVAGIATTDPRLCPSAIPIPEITFKEAAELATFGAKILHPTTLSPAMRGEIPVFVGSSYEADKKGTWIKRQTDKKPLVRAMALQKGQSLLTLSTPKMLYTHGFLYQIFKIFNEHQVSVDSITTSEISVSLTVDDATRLNKNLISDLSKHADVKIEDGLSMVSLIGNNINHTPGLAKKIFSAMEDINVRMICLGASKHNFCFLVNESNGAETIQRLHKTFIEGNQE